MLVSQQMRHLLLLISGICALQVAAQPVLGPSPAPGSGSGSFAIIRVGGGFYATGGDLAKRFPQFASLPVGVYYKSASNITLGVNYTPFMGNRVDYTGLFGGIIGPSGEILDQNGFPTIIRYYMRGSSTTFTAGKLIQASKGSKHGTFELSGGAGFMQHFIRMRFDVGRTPQLEGDYAAGYDRLTNGLQLVQHFRWHYLNTETVSVFAGVDVSEAFTRHRRNWNYADMSADNDLRTDIYFGLSAGLLIPIGLKTSASSNPKYFD